MSEHFSKYDPIGEVDEAISPLLQAVEMALFDCLRFSSDSSLVLEYGARFERNQRSMEKPILEVIERLRGQFPMLNSLGWSYFVHKNMYPLGWHYDLGTRALLLCSFGTSSWTKVYEGSQTFHPPEAPPPRSVIRVPSGILHRIVPETYHCRAVKPGDSSIRHLIRFYVHQ